MTVTSDLAAWALGLRRDDVPDDVVAAGGPAPARRARYGARRARTGLAAPALTVAAGLGGPPEATLLGRGVRVAAPAAALATGTLVHALDFDDTHAGGLVHATAVVLPAVLAVGEEVGATGEEALLAASSASRPCAGSPAPPRTPSTSAACTPPTRAASSRPPW